MAEFPDEVDVAPLNEDLLPSRSSSSSHIKRFVRVIGLHAFLLRHFCLLLLSERKMCFSSVEFLARANRPLQRFSSLPPSWKTSGRLWKSIKTKWAKMAVDRHLPRSCLHGVHFMDALSIPIVCSLVRHPCNCIVVSRNNHTHKDRELYVEKAKRAGARTWGISMDLNPLFVATCVKRVCGRRKGVRLRSFPLSSG